jgi:hypothetical protein
MITSFAEERSEVISDRDSSLGWRQGLDFCDLRGKRKEIDIDIKEKDYHRRIRCVSSCAYADKQYHRGRRACSN